MLQELKRILVGKPRDITDPKLYEKISLIAFMAWVGLGADGLSSSAYGPDEAYRTLGGHTYLAIGLAALMAFTVCIISAAYSKIIEQFPHGGGGYVVATKLLGKHAGVVSGSALLVDYVLTITVSIAAAGDALFSMLPYEYHIWKLPAEGIVIGILTILNLRGVRESVFILTPIFLLFLVTHFILIAGGIIGHAGNLGTTFDNAGAGFSNGLSSLGAIGMLLVFVHAYSLGGGTYTGIEAVSNSVGILREPRVQTAKRTMLYMALSLAFTAAGILFCYLLWDVREAQGKTLNAVLTEKFAATIPLGPAFVVMTLAAEGAILVVAAQAGFTDGPRVLANMAVDSWVPRRFAALSDRLTIQNGVLLMGIASFAALLYTKGDVRVLVVMYSINVFLTFSLSTLGMLIHNKKFGTVRTGLLFFVGFLLCATILVITTLEKFSQGGWVTLAVTGSVISVCYLIKTHYDQVTRSLAKLYETLTDIPKQVEGNAGEPDVTKPVACVLVANYGGLGLHTYMSVFKTFPNHFHGIVFISVGVIDSREFKGKGTVEDLKVNVVSSLEKYVAFAHGQGIPATHRYAIGTDAVEESEKLCLEVAKEFPRVTFFAGRVLFQNEKWYQAILHNETAFAIQKRLQWAGKTVVIVPARLA